MRPPGFGLRRQMCASGSDSEDLVSWVVAEVFGREEFLDLSLHLVASWSIFLVMSSLWLINVLPILCGGGS